MMLGKADISFDNAIHAESVAQEYEIISRQRCDCGGRLQLIRQGLLAHEANHYDLIEVQCRVCHKPHSFLFNISSFFGHETGLA